MRSSVLRLGVLVAGAVAVGSCSSPPDPAAPRAADVELATRGLDRAVGVTTLFASMGVIATNMPAESIASALAVRVMLQTNGCAVTTVSGTTLDIDVSKGCTFASANIVYQGTLSATVVETGSDVLITTSLNLTADGGTPLTGTITPDTSDGNTFSYGADVTFGGVEIAVPALTVGLGGYGASYEGVGTLTGKSGVYAITLTGTHQQFGGCYPDDGTVEIKGGTPPIDETFSFVSDSPQSGAVSVSDGAANPRVLQLPPRKGCPNTPGSMTGVGMNWDAGT